jgi:hypothetical protein
LGRLGDAAVEVAGDAPPSSRPLKKSGAIAYEA